MPTNQEVGGAETLGAARIPIIFVHGTWGRGLFPKRHDEGSSEDCSGTRWFEKGSQFREKLEHQLKGDGLEYSKRSFLWSGANSVFARDRAATRLADELKTDLQNPDATPIIIAHSHGGNVALRALNYLENCSRIRLVTLATPFLKVFARDQSHIPIIAWLLVWSAISAIVFVIALLASLPVLSATVGVDNDRLMFWIIIGILLAAALGSLFIVSWLTGTFVNPRSKTRQSTRAYDIQNAAFYRAIDVSGPRILVIRGVDDEASLTLAAGSIGSRLSSLVLFIVIPAIIFLAMLLIPLSGWLGANFLSSERRDFLYVLVLDGCAFGALALLFLPGVCKSAFGREFLTTAFVCEIASDSTPDTSSSTDVVTLSPVRAAEGKRLRHYIYDHPECVNEIVRWVGRVVKAG